MNVCENMEAYDVPLNTSTRFLLSTSGSQSSIEKHNKALQALGLNIAYFTFSRKITPEGYANLFRAPIVRGGAVTGQGLKSGIVPFLDEIDEMAKCTGAVNTVINDNGKLRGYNTDAFGLEQALSRQLKLVASKIRTAVIYGNGGVSGVAAFVLKKMGMMVTMAGRNPERVAERMSVLGLQAMEGPYDLVINATPVTSLPIEKAVGLLGILKGCKAVFDHNMPEKDGKRNYLQEYCKEHNVHFIPGKEMYDPQMIKQWSLFLDGVEDLSGGIHAISEEEIVRSWEIKSE